MNPSTRALQRLGVTATALALAMAVSTPTFGAPAKDQAADCIEYGDVAKGPAGTIPRDDLHVVHQDPLAKAARTARTARTSARGKPGGTATAAFAPVEIPVRFNVVYKDRSADGGYLSDERIAEQIRVLNEGFAGTGFSFVLEEIDRVKQPEWFNLVSSNGGLPRFYRGGGKEVKMKQYFYGDSTSETLNIYSASLAQSLLGWAYFPSDFTDASTLGDPLPQYRDGVVVDYRSLPAVEGDTGDVSRYTVYGEGDTATHEVGHWLELYHTFQGGCSDPGDYVADTAPEASPAFQCPTGRDTCEGGGVDPITNFMDYTYDSCMTEFTAGQAARMQMAWTEYRAGS
jgi:hypothetical protein